MELVSIFTALGYDCKNHFGIYLEKYFWSINLQVYFLNDDITQIHLFFIEVVTKWLPEATSNHLLFNDLYWFNMSVSNQHSLSSPCLHVFVIRVA